MTEPQITTDVVVPMRTMEVYQADDGRRIEVFKKKGTIPFIKRTQDEDDGIPEFSDLEHIFIGVVHVYTNYGPKEIKFQIPNAVTIKDAFTQYYGLADEAIADLERKIKEAQTQAQDQTQNKIVTAPAGVIDTFNQPDEDGGIIMP